MKPLGSMRKMNVAREEKAYPRMMMKTKALFHFVSKYAPPVSPCAPPWPLLRSCFRWPCAFSHPSTIRLQLCARGETHRNGNTAMGALQRGGALLLRRNGERIRTYGFRERWACRLRAAACDHTSSSCSGVPHGCHWYASACPLHPKHRPRGISEIAGSSRIDIHAIAPGVSAYP